MSHRVTLSPIGPQRVAGTFVSEGRASDAVFAAQRNGFRAVGARWDGAAKVWTFDRSRIVEAIAAFRTVSIPVELHADLSAEVEAAVIREDKARADVVLPEGATLYSHQGAGIAWLRGRKAGLLADDMGLGKTLQTCLAIRRNAPVLVVAPAVAKGVWKREVARWARHFQVSVLAGRDSFRWPAPGEVVVVNYDILPETVKDGKWDVIDPALGPVPAELIVVADEAHALKNPKAQRTIRFRAIQNAARRNGGFVYGLTGTPLLNRPMELWGVLMSLGLAREAFGDFEGFKAAFNAHDGQYAIEWGAPTHHVAECLKKVMLRRTKDEVLDLPGKRYARIYVEVGAVKDADAAARALGAQLTTDDLAVLKRGVEFTTMSKARAALAKAKIPAMLDFVKQCEENGEPLVVFSAHRAPIDELAKREGWAVITGDTSAAERSAIEARFQRGELKGIGGTIDAAGVAITLTHAAQALFVDKDFTPTLNSQAEDRIYRIGQTKSCLYTELVADHPLDERLADLLSTKTSLVNSTVERAASLGAAMPSSAAELLDGVTVKASETPAVEDDFSDLPFLKGNGDDE